MLFSGSRLVRVVFTASVPCLPERTLAMNPGLPGTGIGGLFYILSALWMPICEVRRRWQGDATRPWPLVARQFAIAVGVVAAMTGVFWALDTPPLLNQVAGKMAAHGHPMG